MFNWIRSHSVSSLFKLLSGHNDNFVCIPEAYMRPFPVSIPEKLVYDKESTAGSTHQTEGSTPPCRHPLVVFDWIVFSTTKVSTFFFASFQSSLVGLEEDSSKGPAHYPGSASPVWEEPLAPPALFNFHLVVEVSRDLALAVVLQSLDTAGSVCMVS